MRTRFSDALLRAALVAGLIILPSAAGSFEALGLGDVEVLADAELAEQRAGFAVQGMQVNFGAEIRTFIDDELMVQTNISWQDGAATMSREISSMLTSVEADQLEDGMLQTPSITMRVGDATVLLANAGQTAIMFRPEAPLQTAIINTASNVSVRQEINSTLDLAGYEQYRGAVMTERMAAQLGTLLDFATIAGLSR